MFPFFNKMNPYSPCDSSRPTNRGSFLRQNAVRSARNSSDPALPVHVWLGNERSSASAVLSVEIRAAITRNYKKEKASNYRASSTKIFRFRGIPNNDPIAIANSVSEDGSGTASRREIVSFTSSSPPKKPTSTPPGELVTSPQFRETLEALRESFDFVRFFLPEFFSPDFFSPRGGSLALGP